MHIDLAISLWNYFHYTYAPSLEQILACLRDRGYGVELWGKWRDETDLYGELGRARLKTALSGMPVSLHTAIVNTFELHQKQIDAAAELGARVLVLHSDDLYVQGAKRLDSELAHRMVEYAGARGVRLALENGQLPFIQQALAEIQGLHACLDVGHVYQTPEPMSRFLEVVASRLIHLHLQDLALDPLPGMRFPGTAADHHTLGAGGIPQADWRLLIDTLERIEFKGTAVFEIQPPNPLQTAYHGRLFLENLGMRFG
jgi:sugar phosphate isomerase/epimerase